MPRLTAAAMRSLEWAVGLPMQAPYRTEPAALMADPDLPQWQEATPTAEQADALLAAMAEAEAKGLAVRIGAQVDGDGMQACVWALPSEATLVSYGQQEGTRLLRVDLYRGLDAMRRHQQRRRNGGA